jgi:GNAT superfamily N-acetyltransferase
MIALRAATADDIPLILRFIRELAEYEKLSGQCVATEDALRDTLFGVRSYAEVLIAAWEQTPAGFALFFHNYSTFRARPGIYLEDLYVSPEYRGRGLGKALLQAIARLAVERNCARVEWSVLDWNEPSIRFYESLGAVCMREWQIYRLTGDALLRLGSE